MFPTVEGTAAGDYRYAPSGMGSNQARITYLANDLVVLQYTPRNVDTIVVPIGPRHMLVNIGVNARHNDCRWLPSPRPQSRYAAGSRGGRLGGREWEGRERSGEEMTEYKNNPSRPSN